MNSENYVIDQKRGKAWGDPWEALNWYREELARVEAELAEIRDRVEAAQRPVPRVSTR